ncbi:Lrp/AsnC family transcriptional regulator [Hydrogenobacter hydrogenophilus]|uniref:siroheme decarboxylase n=1 Tax=Hydrogenobacter hydrogenophilus TaxID=35835 RepID=A0A285NZ38_9AQUI|nr:Lrp/AsnC family transcriptional regulator [Hydrogenobacter hydrogenophilus]SNZ14203.1 transcriptional regulator, AsnC family [Hydrogenobacter hydrogenophilus]
MGNEFDKILKIIQQDLPLVSRPFLTLAESVGITESELLKTIEKLVDDGVVREIAPIYDSKMLGYDSALVAFKVPQDKLQMVADFVSSCPTVSHNYERTHPFNLWFTLAVPPDTLSLEDVVRLMAERTGTLDYLVLRAVRTFKIGVRLDYESAHEKESVGFTHKPYKPLKEHEKEVVRVVQGRMPLTERPFFEYAQMLGMKEEELLNLLKDLKERGVLRRISAVLYHRRAGFVANAMSVWNVSEDRVEDVGNFMAGFKGVSHCYERTTGESWRYNLFAMMHGRSEEELYNLAKHISQEKGLDDYALLFSTKEFKKRRIKYFSEDFKRWLKALT